MLRTASKNLSKTPADGWQRDQLSKQLNRNLELLAKLDQGQTTESRQDPITGDWTILAPGRHQRPDEYQLPPGSERRVKVDCPFCAGAESNTPPAIWVGKLTDDDTTTGESRQLIIDGCQADASKVRDWSVRVVPNKYPAVTQTRAVSATRDEPTASALFPRRVVTGGHEVIVESPRHVESLTELDLAEVSLVFKAYRDRMAHWYNAKDVGYISLFKNVRGQAGASLAHSHSQLIAANVIPTQIQTVCKRLANYRAKTGCCLQCDLLRAELKDESRVIAINDSLVAYCPFASPMPMLVRVTSQIHQERFDLLDDRTIDSVSRMVFRVIDWLEQLHPQVAYNLLVHSRPPNLSDGGDAHHWSIEIFPRLTRLAGFEFSSDCMINPMKPEIAAARYRTCAIAEDPRLL